MEGITHKALTQALRHLERNGLIVRKVLATSPAVAVEYSITKLGRALQVPLGAAYDWAINHLPEIEQAQGAYDERAHG